MNIISDAADFARWSLGVAGTILILCFGCGSVWASPLVMNPSFKYNICDNVTAKIPPAAKTYASTGKVPAGFKPTHSRAWYAAAMGLTSVLNALIIEHPSLIENQKLLNVAVARKGGASLRVLLSHGADPNATVMAATPANDEVPLLEMATVCRRPVNLLYLLAAGANVYATDSHGGYYAMTYALVNGKIPNIFTGWQTGILLLLGAGFDPRCPLAKGDNRSALEFMERTWARHKKGLVGKTYNPTNKKRVDDKLRRLVTLFKGVAAIHKGQSSDTSCQ